MTTPAFWEVTAAILETLALWKVSNTLNNV